MEGLDWLGAHHTPTVGEAPPAGQALFFVVFGLGFLAAGCAAIGKLWSR